MSIAAVALKTGPTQRMSNSGLIDGTIAFSFELFSNLYIRQRNDGSLITVMNNFPATQWLSRTT